MLLTLLIIKPINIELLKYNHKTAYAKDNIQIYEGVLMRKYLVSEILDDYVYDNKYYGKKVQEVEQLNYEIKTALERYQGLIETMPENQDLKKQIEVLVKRQIAEEEQLGKLLEKKRKAEEIINLVGQPHKTVLYYHYMQGKTFEEIACMFRYSRKRIYQLHTEGMEAITSKYIAINQ